jgi:hypothetical protein
MSYVGTPYASETVVAAVNYVTLAFALVSSVFIVLLYRLTRVKAFFILWGAWGWTLLVRTGISWDLPFLHKYATPLTVITMTFHMVGLIMLFLALRKFYGINGRHTENELEAASTLAKAATAAQIAREHAVDAADAAEAARLYAKQAMLLADEATLNSRRAVKASGIAAEASRAADSKVGEGSDS